MANQLQAPWLGQVQEEIREPDLPICDQCATGDSLHRAANPAFTA